MKRHVEAERNLQVRKGLAWRFVGRLAPPVRAVYAGRVAFAERYGPYGRLVIVDRGEHYYTVSEQSCLDRYQGWRIDHGR